MHLRLFWIPEPLISLLLYIYWIFFVHEVSQQGLYDIWKTTSLDSNRINVSSKKKSFLCTKHRTMRGWKNNLLYTCTGKPQMSAPVWYWNPFQNKLDTYSFVCVTQKEYLCMRTLEIQAIINFTLKLPWVTKIEFLLTISIQYQADRWWE